MVMLDLFSWWGNIGRFPNSAGMVKVNISLETPPTTDPEYAPGHYLIDPELMPYNPLSVSL